MLLYELSGIFIRLISLRDVNKIIIDDISPVLAKMLGYKIADLIGKDFFTILDKCTIDSIENIISYDNDIDFNIILRKISDFRLKHITGIAISINLRMISNFSHGKDESVSLMQIYSIDLSSLFNAFILKSNFSFSKEVLYDDFELLKNDISVICNFSDDFIIDASVVMLECNRFMKLKNIKAIVSNIISEMQELNNHGPFLCHYSGKNVILLIIVGYEAKDGSYLINKFYRRAYSILCNHDENCDISVRYNDLVTGFFMSMRSLEDITSAFRRLINNSGFRAYTA